GYTSRPAIAWPFPTLVILESGVDVVGRIHVDSQCIHFAAFDRHAVQTGPPAVVRKKHAAIGGRNHSVGILRIDPKRAEVTERATEKAWASASRPVPASVGGSIEARAGDPELVGVIRIYCDLVERVAGLAAHVDIVRVHFAPRGARVVGAVDLAVD